MRKDWDSYLMDMAKAASTRGTCDRAYVGAVIAIDNRIVATGYNGSPSGLPHCSEVGHYMVDDHCCRTIHAEENAILQAASLGIKVEGATMYVTHEPCMHCRKRIIQLGFKRVVYFYAYRNVHNAEFVGDVEWVHYDKVQEDI